MSNKLTWIVIAAAAILSLFLLYGPILSLKVMIPAVVIALILVVISIQRSKKN